MRVPGHDISGQHNDGNYGENTDPKIGGSFVFEGRIKVEAHEEDKEKSEDLKHYSGNY